MAGGNGDGDSLQQLDCPCGVAIGQDGSLYVGDCANHRVVCWPRGAKEGRVVAGGSRGDDLHQLSSPNGVALGPDGSLYVADIENNRVMRWRPGAAKGEVAAGGKGAGPEPGQLDGPCGVWVTPSGDLLVSERGSQMKNYRVTSWGKDGAPGAAVAGGNGHGSELSQLDCPWGVVTDAAGTIIVVDSGNHRVVSWRPGGSEGSLVAGGNGRGASLRQLKSPCGVALLER